MSRVSNVLNRLIDDLRVSLGERDQLVRTNIDKEAKIIATLVECREKVESITSAAEKRDRELDKIARRPPYASIVGPPRYIDSNAVYGSARIGDGSGPGADAIYRALNRRVQEAEKRVVEHAGIRNPLR